MCHFDRGFKSQEKVKGLSKEIQLFLQLDKLMGEQLLFTNSTLKRKEVANILGTNETYLVDAIHEGAQGATFREYILELRLNYAVLLLVGQLDISIVAIGEDVGFSSRSTFFRVFRNRFGMSPKKFRQIYDHSI